MRPQRFPAPSAKPAVHPRSRGRPRKNPRPQVHAPPLPYRCGICRRSFAHRNGLSEHVLTHRSAPRQPERSVHTVQLAAVLPVLTLFWPGDASACGMMEEMSGSRVNGNPMAAKQAIGLEDEIEEFFDFAGQMGPPVLLKWNTEGWFKEFEEKPAKRTDTAVVEGLSTGGGGGVVDCADGGDYYRFMQGLPNLKV